MSRLKDKYLSEVVKGLQEKYNYKNVMELPKVTKVVINMAVGEAVTNSKALDAAVGDDDYLRPEAYHYESKEIHCCIQSS